MAFFAVIDKTGFQRRLDTCDHGLINIAFALFAPFDFDFVVEQFLSVDDGQAALFSLRGVDKHPFHDAFLFIALQHRASVDPTMPSADAGKRKGNTAQSCAGLTALAATSGRWRVDAGELKANWHGTYSHGVH